MAWALGLFVVGAATLTNDNGARILAPLAVPAVLTVMAWIALHHQSALHSRAARRAAWIAIGLLVLFSLLTGFSIGLFVLPTAALLIAAAALTPLHGQRITDRSGATPTLRADSSTAHADERGLL
ncbi:MAG: hypothetical protein ACR2IP_10015 [Solirubrobacteraceae bacterium]